MGHFCQNINDHSVDKTFLGVPDRLTKPYSYKGSKSTKYSKRWSLKQTRCPKVDQDSRKAKFTRNAAITASVVSYCLDQPWNLSFVWDSIFCCTWLTCSLCKYKVLLAYLEHQGMFCQLGGHQWFNRSDPFPSLYTLSHHVPVIAPIVVAWKP